MEAEVWPWGFHHAHKTQAKSGWQSNQTKYIDKTWASVGWGWTGGKNCKYSKIERKIIAHHYQKTCDSYHSRPEIAREAFRTTAEITVRKEQELLRA